LRQVKALITGLAFGVVLAAQGFTLAALLNGRVMADSVAMIAWADAKVALIILGCGVLATFILNGCDFWTPPRAQTLARQDQTASSLTRGGSARWTRTHKTDCRQFITEAVIT
jgi:hypothetical protein